MSSKDSTSVGDTCLKFKWKLSNFKNSSMHMSDATKDSSVTNVSFIGSNQRLPHKLGRQQLSDASKSTPESLYLHSQLHDTEEESVCRSQESQSMLLRPHQTYDPIGQPQLLHKGRYLKRRHILVQKCDFEPLHLQSNTKVSHSINCNNLSEQMPGGPLIAHDMIKQELPLGMKEYISSNSSVLTDVLFGDHSMFPRKPAQYQAIQNLLFLYEHARNCQNQENHCNFFQCRNLKSALAHILHCKDANCAKGCYKYKNLFDHYAECSNNFCSICGPVRARIEEVSQRNISNGFADFKTPLATVASMDQEESACKRAKTTSHFGQNQIFGVNVESTKPNHHFGGELQADQLVRLPLDTNTGNQKLIKTCTLGDANTTSAKLVESQNTDSILGNSGETYGSTEDAQIEIKENPSVEPDELANVAICSEPANEIQLGFPMVEISDGNAESSASANVVETRIGTPLSVDNDELANVAICSQQTNVVQLGFPMDEISDAGNVNLSPSANMAKTKTGSPKRVTSNLDTSTSEMHRVHIGSFEQHVDQHRRNMLFSSLMSNPHVGRLEKPQEVKTASPTSSTNEEKVLCDMLPGYIPNEHHRVVAHASLSSGGNLAPLSEETLSKHHFGCQMSAEQYSDSQNDQFSNENRSKWMPCMSQIPFYGNGDTSLSFKWKLSNFKNSSMYASDATKDSSISNRSSVGFNQKLSHKLSQQQLSDASKKTPQSLYLHAQLHDLEEESVCRSHESKPMLLSPHQAYDPIGQPDFEPLHSQSTVKVSHSINYNNLSEQMPGGPLVIHDMNKQELALGSKECVSTNSSNLTDVLFGDHSMFPRRPAQYQAIQNLLFLYEHARNCQNQENDCNFFQCSNLKSAFAHILYCKDANCTKRCNKYKSLFDHYAECSNIFCSICGPVRARMKEVSQRNISNGFTESKTSLGTVVSMDKEESVFQRGKTTNHFGQNETFEAGVESTKPNHHFGGELQAGQLVRLPLDTNTGNQNLIETCTLGDANTSSAKLAESQNTDSILRNSGETYVATEDTQIEIKENLTVEPDELANVAMCSEPANEIQLGFPMVQTKDVGNIEFSADANMIETKIGDPLSVEADVLANVTICSQQMNVDQLGFPMDEIGDAGNVKLSSLANVAETKTEAPKRVTSLLDTFTVEMLRVHISSLEQHVDQDKAKKDKSQDMEHLVDQNLCSLCRMEKLTFEAPPRYCSSCYKLINPRGVYYTIRSLKYTDYECGAKISFCSKCYGSSGESIKVARQEIRKVNLERRLNYAESDAENEWWVQCDKCKAWQHQICALFSGKRKDALQSEYTCPECCLRELECEMHKPVPRNAVLRATDLPKTMMSDHIENWLFEHLQQEREERARKLQITVDEVPGANDLVIRVVSSVDKKVEVNPGFQEVFKEEMYPAYFPYKSKVILLFQTIEGADVCLFGMYVQEYGSECSLPNQRRVCISYIDSVKYFRPEIKAVTGEALRTFVYHEILIGYLDYCKKRGFTSCYIWACPSLRQDYYILYCHPKTQKTPKSEKLREWYQVMIRKAIKEKVIQEQTNLYDHFFVPTSESKVKVTAAQLPYFDSDFWPGKADFLLEDKNKSQAKGTKAVIERALRAAKRDASTGNPKDILLMHQLGEVIRPMKEDFIIVHLQHTCKYCYQPIMSEKLWVCSVCKNFQLCMQCHDKMQDLDKKDRHPITAKEKHSFQLVEIDVLADTHDEDGTIESKLFDVRTGFLNFCQNEQYQFDTLRRAKHSTLMILYHLHNPMEYVFTSSCAMCHGSIDGGQNWHCMNCQGYRLCDSCYLKGTSHHQLVSHTMLPGINLQPKQQRSGRLNVHIVLDALLHAAKCYAPRCTYPYCLKVKKLFLHSRRCKVRVPGGCISCKKIWLLLQHHACICQDLDCHMPRCRDLKVYKMKVKNVTKERNRLHARVSASATWN
ncbi:histone acetyltransferase HAC12-like isoform X2 [Zingiber officinale]|uniref:histone acetyltransferase HAC12-like isoform X2 n=1 Tax=Zingiber officinale TaxID=94328 RepID=UPI001C4BC262|nr:histone acetyltransferase HAC12-like isoform X2 [Zingiber officinale]